MLNRSSLATPSPSFCKSLLRAQPAMTCEFGSDGGGGREYFDARYGFRSMLFLSEDCATANTSKSLQVQNVARLTSHVTRHTSHVTRRTSHVARHTSHVTRHPHLPLPFQCSSFFASSLSPDSSATPALAFTQLSNSCAPHLARLQTKNDGASIDIISFAVSASPIASPLSAASSASAWCRCDGSIARECKARLTLCLQLRIGLGYHHSSCRRRWVGISRRFYSG